MYISDAGNFHALFHERTKAITASDVTLVTSHSTDSRAEHPTASAQQTHLCLRNVVRPP